MADTGFAKSRVEDLISEHGDVAAVLKNFMGYDVWVLTNGVTIRLPKNHARLSVEEVEEIAGVKLGMSTWDFDYWLGEQDK